MTLEELIKVNPGFVDELRGGKPYVNHPGLVYAGRVMGVSSIETELQQWDADTSAAVVKATVSGELGTFTGLGDAAPDNLERTMVPAALRMAETRAVNRALRLYTGLATTSAEEMPPEHPAATQRRQVPDPRSSRPEPTRIGMPDRPAPPDTPHDGPRCPCCGGDRFWDNITDKRAGTHRGPAVKCKRRECDAGRGYPWGIFDPDEAFVFLYGEQPDVDGPPATAGDEAPVDDIPF